jgi:PST family polysaccharide transporter
MNTNKGLSKYLVNTSWLFGYTIYRIIIVLFVTVWLARYLGPNNFGVFNYSLSFVTLLSVISTLSLDKLINKKILQPLSNQNEILGTSFVLRILGTILLINIAAFTIRIIRFDDSLVFSLVVIFSVSYIFKSFDVIKYWLESQVEAKYSSIAEAISITLSSIIKLLLIRYEAPLIAFAWAVFAETLFMAVGLIIFYKLKSHSVFLWRSSKKTMIDLLNEAWPLIFAGAFYLIYTRIDQIMLGEMIGNESVGVYAAAVKISEGLLVIPTVIATSFFPAMLNTRNKNNNLYLARTQHLLNIMVIIGLSAGICVYILATPIITIVFTESYRESSTVLSIHVWGATFTAMSTISFRYFIAEGLQKTSFYRGLTGLFINIFLNYMLIPKYGTSGAALATVISQVIALYLFNVVNNSTRKIFYMQTKALLLIGIFYTFRYIYAYRYRV